MCTHLLLCGHQGFYLLYTFYIILFLVMNCVCICHNIFSRHITVALYKVELLRIKFIFDC